MSELATAKWVRVRLSSPGKLTDGEVVLRADRVKADTTHVRFFVGDEEVFRLPRDYYRTHAWFVDRPTFAEWLKARRAHYPRQGRVWSLEEVEQLRAAVTGALSWADWEALAVRFGRSVPSVQRKAAQIKGMDRVTW